jgi:hypothetical protein
MNSHFNHANQDLTKFSRSVVTSIFNIVKKQVNEHPNLYSYKDIARIVDSFCLFTAKEPDQLKRYWQFATYSELAPRITKTDKLVQLLLQETDMKPNPSMPVFSSIGKPNAKE